MSEMVRAVRAEDLPVLQEIERASAQRYREFGLDQVAEDESASIEVLAGYAVGGRAWVAENADGAPAGYILVDAVDGAAHIGQVSVAPGEVARGLDPASRVVMRRGLDRGMYATGRAVVLVRRAERHDVAAAAEIYLRSRHAAVPAIPPLAHDEDDVRGWFVNIVFPQRELWIAEDASGAVVRLGTEMCAVVQARRRLADRDGDAVSAGPVRTC